MAGAPEPVRGPASFIQNGPEVAMKKLLLIAAAVLAFTGARGAARSSGAAAAAAPRRLSFATIWPILLAPRWLRVPLLLRALVGGGRRPPTNPRR
jgi:hypothetical protein